MILCVVENFSQYSQCMLHLSATHAIPFFWIKNILTTPTVFICGSLFICHIECFIKKIPQNIVDSLVGFSSMNKWMKIEKEKKVMWKALCGRKKMWLICNFVIFFFVIFLIRYNAINSLKKRISTESECFFDWLYQTKNKVSMYSIALKFDMIKIVAELGKYRCRCWQQINRNDGENSRAKMLYKQFEFYEWNFRFCA